MNAEQRTKALRLADILGGFPTDQPRRDAAALLRTLAVEPQFPPDYPDGPDREPPAEPQSDFDAWQANPYTKMLQDSIANDYVPKHSSEPVDEPVAWADKITFESAMRSGHGCDVWPVGKSLLGRELLPLYLRPAPAQTPLTDEQIMALWHDGRPAAIAFARAVLKAQKEKT